MRQIKGRGVGPQVLRWIKAADHPCPIVPAVNERTQGNEAMPVDGVGCFAKSRSLAIALLALAFFAHNSWAADSEDRIVAGRSLARDACSACHQVSPRQKRPPPVFDPDQQANVRAPTFMSIARDPRKNAAYLRKVITRPHYPMREQSYDEDDLAAIIAYIQSLRPRANPR